MIAPIVISRISPPQIIGHESFPSNVASPVRFRHDDCLLFRAIDQLTRDVQIEEIEKQMEKQKAGLHPPRSLRRRLASNPGVKT
jgi:hypothetical protein